MTSKGRAALELTLNVLLTVSTVVVAGAVAWRTFRPAGGATPLGKPISVSTWMPSAEALSVDDPRSAVVRMVVVEDPECPVCRTFHSELASVDKRIRDQFRVQRVLIPLSYHKHATAAIRASECAADARRFDEFLAAVYASQDSFGTKGWGRIAGEAGIADTASISRCAAARDTSSRMLAALRFAGEARVDGTPTVFVDGWRLPFPPNRRQIEAIVLAKLGGENPLAGRAWRNLVDSTRAF